MSTTDWLVDIVIALGALGIGMLQVSLSANLFVPDAFTRMLLGIRTATPSIFALLATFLTCFPLIARRKAPWIVYTTSLLIWVIFTWGLRISSLSIVAILVALFTIAFARGRGEALASGGIALLVMLVTPAFTGISSLSGLMLFQNASLVIVVMLAGYSFHARQELIEEAEARAVEAERTRESEASRRVEEERVRIAREIHDITAHSLSAVSIQAAAAERLIDSDPQAAKEAISQVRDIAKTSLTDMRAMVGVLRGEATDEHSSPVEGTDRMGDLVDYLEEACVSCKLDMVDYDRALAPSHVDIAIFGIAREACTNIVRHSSATKADITLRISNGWAFLEVSDNGNGFDLSATGSGHGLEGMRERAQLLGGIFEASSSVGNGATIKARIPLKVHRSN